MTKLLVIRHGHVEGIEPERFRGRADLSLTETGQKQAEVTGRRVAAKWSIAMVYTSPLSRSVATARAIALASNVAVEPLAGLIDIDYGAWQGLSADEARLRWPAELQWWYRSPHLAEIPDGETLADVFARVTGALGEILRRHSNETVAIVGHDCVNRLILLAALELPLSHYRRLRPDPCSISELDFADSSFIVRSLNDVSHLADG